MRPDCVPAGIRSSSSPSRVGKVTVVPSAACTIDTWTVVSRSSFTRVKRS